MPTQVGIHDFAAYRDGKSWMPASAGMTAMVQMRRSR